MKKITVLKILAAPLIALSISPAMADNTQSKRTTNVKSSKTQADSAGLYSPLGVRIGSFMLKPKVESHNEWNDNIYYRQSGAISDFIFHIKPTVDINSTWSRHALNLSVGADVMFYKNHSTEDKQNYFVNLDGRFDILKDTFATAAFYHKDLQEARSSPEPIVGASVKPLEYSVTGGTVGFEHKINRVRGTLSHDISHYDYINGSDSTGAVIQNSLRSRMVNTTTARLGYELFSGYEGYVKGVYNFIDYDHLWSNQGNIDRSSDAYLVALGLTTDLGNTLVADAHIGYQSRTYRDARLKGISGVSGGLTLTWLPTRLTTVRTDIDRTIQETSQIGQSGFFSTTFNASVEQQLMHNLVFAVNGGYGMNDYSGNNVVSREDTFYNAGVNLKYLVNRNFYVKTGYDYRTRSSNLVGSGYDANSIYLTVGAQL